MAQIVKLKRTSVSGKVPTISNIELGELAINTYDGRIFFEKNDGSATVQEILTTNTGRPITGSVTLNGDISATNITLSGNLTVEGTTTTIDSTNLNIGDNIIELNYGGTSTTSGIITKDATGGSTISGSLLWDATNDYWKLGKLGSESEVITTSNIVTNLPSGVISGSTQLPSGIVSQSSQTVAHLSNQDVDLGTGDITASYFVGDGSQLTNVSATISENATVTGSFSNSSSFTVNHAFETKNVIVSVYDTNDSQIIPQSITLTDNNNVQITLSAAQSGFAVVAKGGHIVSGSAGDASNLNGQPASYYLDYSNLNNIPSGIISGSEQLPSGLISGSSQLEGFVSQSGNFVANETIIATGTNSVTSSNILALDTVNNYLGINQSSPEVTLHMTGDGAQTAQIRMEQYNDSSDAPDIRTRKARGTSASPAKNNAGDFIYRQNSERYNGSSYTTVGQFAVDANSSNADRFQLTLTVSEDGNTIDAAAAQFKIDGNDGGAITFNNAYKFPTSDGSANEVLTTDGSGVLSFGDVTSLLPSGVVSGSSQIAFNDVQDNPFINGTTHITASYHLVPLTNETYDLGSSTLRWRDLYLSGSTIDLGGTIITRDNNGDINFKDSGTLALKKVVVNELQIGSGATARKIKVDGDGKIKFSDKDDVATGDDLTLPTGVISGSAQITDLTTYKEEVENYSSYAVKHDLNEQYPIVQAWNTSTSQQEVPTSITSDSVNQVTVVFSTTFAGVIIVKK